MIALKDLITGIVKGTYLILRAFGRTLKTQILWARFNIGYNSSVGKECVLGGENVIGQNCIISRSVLGRATYCANNTVISNCEIGAYTSIGSNVSIGLYSHPTRGYISTFPGFHYTWNATPYLDRPSFFDVHKRTHVGSDVWIGDSVMVLNGVSIGDGAIVGAGAVVTRDVPPYAVVCGVPAKVMRYRFSESYIHKLLGIRWWDWPVDKIAKDQDLFADVERFLAGADNV